MNIHFVFLCYLQLGAGLKDQDFHAGSRRVRGTEAPNFPLPKSRHHPKESSQWEEPKADPYSVFSVYARQQRNQGINSINKFVSYKSIHKEIRKVRQS